MEHTSLPEVIREVSDFCPELLEVNQ